MGKIILCATERHPKNKAVFWHSQNGFMKGKSCLSNSIFYNNITHLVAEGKVVHKVFLGFSKAFDTILHSVLQENSPNLR